MTAFGTGSCCYNKTTGLADFVLIPPLILYLGTGHCSNFVAPLDIGVQLLLPFVDSRCFPPKELAIFSITIPIPRASQLLFSPLFTSSLGSWKLARLVPQSCVKNALEHRSMSGLPLYKQSPAPGGFDGHFRRSRQDDPSYGLVEILVSCLI